MRKMSAQHVSVKSRERALAGIRRKVALLEQWLDEKHVPWAETKKGELERDSRGDPLLDWYPKTVVDFARWTGTQNSPAASRQIVALGGFETFGRSTLDRAPDLKATVLRVLRDVDRLAQAQHRAGRKDSIIELLTVAADAERARKQEAQRLYVEALASIEALRQELAIEQRLRGADVQRLTADLNAARKENAVLVNKLRESAALHLAGGRDVS